MSDLLYFKVDSTGTDVYRDRVIKITATKVVDGDRENFSRYILPNGNFSISIEAEEFCGVSEEFIRQNGDPQDLVLREFNDFINSGREIDIVTFNGLNFDVRILANEYLRSGMTFAGLYHRMFDLYEIESRNNRNNFSSVYERHVGECKDGREPEDLETLFWTMSEHYTKDQMLGDLKPTMLDLDDTYRMSKTGDLVFTRGKYSGRKVFDIISSDPDYIRFLFSSRLTDDSKRIVVHEYDRKKKMLEM